MRHLESQGCKFLRFWNSPVLNDIEGALKAIMNAPESNERGWRPTRG
jgi:very-short-patch-repair endonuclease